ncbi:hypothetical protein Tco_0977364 [Tanacetum coccineum]|uniref:Reverse transcriptase domain-containing protein n=1 Tax=Tanacetum coccineum TaxID=301880 RepID=A0ABQ5EL05_9ASTR
MTANRIDVIDMACEEYSQEVLGFSNMISSGNPTPYYDPIISTISSTLTPFGDSDFLLFEEADSFLAIEDDPTSPEVDPTYYDPDGDILLLEAILNSDPSPPPPKGRYFQKLEKRSNICEANYDNSSVNEPHCGEKEALIDGYKVHKEPSLGNFLISRVLTQSFVPTKFSWKRTTKPFGSASSRSMGKPVLFAKKDVKPRLMRWIPFAPRIDVVIRDKKGAENLAA